MKSEKYIIYAKNDLVLKNDKNAFTVCHKVRDHCNYTGKFRRVAHSIYNLRCKTPK